MPALWIAGAGLALAVGTTAYSAANQPTAPNLASSSRQLSDAQAKLLPIQRGMAAAAQSGGKYTFSLPPGVNPSDYPQFADLPQGTQAAQTTQVFVPGQAKPGDKDKTPKGEWVTYNPEDFKSGGKYASLGTPQLRQITNQNGTYTIDFNGYGSGQTQATIAKQQAAGQLALAQKYDPQFIASALKQEQQADPNSFAARQRMSELIQGQIAHPPTNPEATTLENQVDAQLKAGKGLDPMETGVLNNAVQQALNDRNSSGAGADFSSPLTTGAAGVARQQAGQQKALGELTSGTTPEDVQYRQEQQNLANLQAEISGQTPQSQFKSLSAAQSGPTPTYAGAQLPTMPGGQVQQAGNAALNANATNLSNLGQQANPWMAGVSSLLAAGNAAGNLGYQPFGK